MSVTNPGVSINAPANRISPPSTSSLVGMRPASRERLDAGEDPSALPLHEPRAEDALDDQQGHRLPPADDLRDLDDHVELHDRAHDEDEAEEEERHRFILPSRVRTRSGRPAGTVAAMWVSRVVQAPAAHVWRVLIDTTTWTQWGPSISEVRHEGRFLGPGSHGQIRPPVGPWLDFRVTRFDEGRQWTWSVAGVSGDRPPGRLDRRTALPRRHRRAPRRRALCAGRRARPSSASTRWPASTPAPASPDRP